MDRQSGPAKLFKWGQSSRGQTTTSFSVTSSGEIPRLPPPTEEEADLAEPPEGWDSPISIQRHDTMCDDAARTKPRAQSRRKKPQGAGTVHQHSLTADYDPHPGSQLTIEKLPTHRKGSFQDWTDRLSEVESGRAPGDDVGHGPRQIQFDDDATALANRDTWDTVLGGNFGPHAYTDNYHPSAPLSESCPMGMPSSGDCWSVDAAAFIDPFAGEAGNVVPRIAYQEENDDTQLEFLQG